MSWNKLTQLQFEEKGRIIHGDKFDLSKSLYVNCKSKIDIICPIHGVFNLNTLNFLTGTGCKKCSADVLSEANCSNLDEFKSKFYNLFGDKYDLSKVEYKRSWDKVIVGCRIHGDFLCTPNGLLSNKGCPECGFKKVGDINGINPKGWDHELWSLYAFKSKKFEGFKCYIIKCFNDNESFYKIGRTFQKLKRRLRHIPYDNIIEKVILFDNAKDCCDYESFLKSTNLNNKYTPLINFGGKNECFSCVEMKA